MLNVGNVQTANLHPITTPSSNGTDTGPGGDLTADGELTALGGGRSGPGLPGGTSGIRGMSQGAICSHGKKVGPAAKWGAWPAAMTVYSDALFWCVFYILNTIIAILTLRRVYYVLKTTMFILG